MFEDILIAVERDVTEAMRRAARAVRRRHEGLDYPEPEDEQLREAA